MPEHQKHVPVHTHMFMVLYRCRMCWCRLHVALWSHIGILMRLLAAEPHSIAGLLFPFRCISGMILMTLCSMVWDWRVSRAGTMPFIGLAARSIFCLLLENSLTQLLLEKATQCCRKVNRRNSTEIYFYFTLFNYRFAAVSINSKLLKMFRVCLFNCE